MKRKKRKEKKKTNKMDKKNDAIKWDNITYILCDGICDFGHGNFDFEVNFEINMFFIHKIFNDPVHTKFPFYF